MRKDITFTSTLSPELFSMLDVYSKKLKTPKSRLINEAVKAFINQLKKEEYINSFRRVKADGEIKELSESGLDDFLEIISK